MVCYIAFALNLNTSIFVAESISSRDTTDLPTDKGDQTAATATTAKSLAPDESNDVTGAGDNGTASATTKDAASHKKSPSGMGDGDMKDKKDSVGKRESGSVGGASAKDRAAAAGKIGASSGGATNSSFGGQDSRRLLSIKILIPTELAGS